MQTVSSEVRAVLLGDHDPLRERHIRVIESRGPELSDVDRPLVGVPNVVTAIPPVRIQGPGS